MTRSIRSLVGLLLATGISIAACSTAATPTPAAGGGVPPTIATSTSPTLGVFLTGAGGKTLYIFTKDTTPNASTCTGACATNWPPLTVPAGGTIAAPGVGGTFSGFARPDGTTQVANKGMPLYYFAGDSKAGDTNGQGSGGVWFVATPAGGGPPAGSPAAPSPAASPTDDRYNY